MALRTVLLVFAGACASSARVPASTGVPPLLVAALLEGRSAIASPEVVVGEVPAGYPAELIPGSPSRVVGGVSEGREVQVVFEDSTRRVAAILEDLFERAGYTRPKPSPGSGFASGYTSQGFCGISGTVHVQALGGAQRHMARVTFARHLGGLSCGVATAPSTRIPVRLLIPDLTAPPGTSMQRSRGGSSGSDEVTSGGELMDATLAPEMVLAHYAAQLSAAGWKGLAPATGVRVASQYFEAKDGAGASWSGTLMVTRRSTSVVMSIIMRADTQP